MSELVKLAKVLGDSAISELEALDNAALQKRIRDAELHIAESERARDADSDLEAAKEQAKEMAAPYRDAIKRERAVQRYALIMIEQRGGL